MKQKEAMKLGVLEFLRDGKLTAAQAAQKLHISVRQVFRLEAKFKIKGAEALVHGNRGRKPAHAIPQEVRQTIADLAKEDFQGASLNQMSELLEEKEKICVCAKTVGNILKEEGIDNPHSHKGASKHRTRERRAQEGELVQIDASPFDWFETGEVYNLHGAIDDATGKVLAAHFEPTETMKGYIFMLAKMLRKHGVPAAFYSDRHTIFFSQLREKLSDDDEFEGRKAPLTQYGRMLWDLGIEHIPAYSPQAKGRIERLWGTFQSRLVIELRLAKIKSMDEANEFVSKYLDKHNKQFSVEARNQESVFLPCPDAESLSAILSQQYERKSTGGSEISFEGTRYQLVKGKESVLMRKGDVVTVLRSVMDGKLCGIWNEKIYELVKSPDAQPKEAKKVVETPAAEPKAKYIPPQDHPWRGNGKRKEEANRQNPDWQSKTAA